MSRRGPGLGALAAAVTVLAADQLTKALVRSQLESGDRSDLLLGIELVHVKNDGVAFGLFGGSATVVLIVTLIATSGLGLYLLTQSPKPGQWIAIGLLAGGAAGNLIDRIFEGGVTDFIDLGAWPAFNVADIAITLGVVTLLVNELLADVRARRRA